MVRVADSFFRLPGSPPDIDQSTFIDLAKAGATVSKKIYRPDKLISPKRPQRWRIKESRFVEISFSKTLIEGLEFENCTFESCLFIGTIIRNCRFTNCTFKNCNPYRIELSNVYINPQSFDGCLDEKRYQNIGAHLVPLPTVIEAAGELFGITTFMAQREENCASGYVGLRTLELGLVARADPRYLDNLPASDSLAGIWAVIADPRGYPKPWKIDDSWVVMATNLIKRRFGAAVARH
jgi:hypothetical protein